MCLLSRGAPETRAAPLSFGEGSGVDAIQMIIKYISFIFISIILPRRAVNSAIWRAIRSKALRAAGLLNSSHRVEVKAKKLSNSAFAGAPYADKGTIKREIAAVCADRPLRSPTGPPAPAGCAGRRSNGRAQPVAARQMKYSGWEVCVARCNRSRISLRSAMNSSDVRARGRGSWLSMISSMRPGRGVMTTMRSLR